MPSWFPMPIADTLFKVQVVSTDEAQEIASFPVRLPTAIPPAFKLVSFHHIWPPHIDADGRSRKIYADWNVALYRDHQGHLIQIYQGFFAPMLEWADLEPPADSVGTVDVSGVLASWITANPAPGMRPVEVDGRYVISTWQRNTDFAYVGWQDAVYPPPPGQTGASPRYYGLASDSLSVSELRDIASSVPAAQE